MDWQGEVLCVIGGEGWRKSAPAAMQVLRLLPTVS